jgi:hypothetical protein
MRTKASALLAGVLAAGAMLVAQSGDLHTVLPPDAIPSIDRPTFEPAANTRWFADEELMIGLVGEHEQRAYSTWSLDVHEIVNDMFEGHPIAVTW